MVKATVSRIVLFPVKSLDGIEVPAAAVTETGTLYHDRQFAIFDADGKLINGKSTPLIHGLRATFDLEKSMMTLSGNQLAKEHFSLMEDRQRINTYLSDFFSQSVQLKESHQGEFLDDPEQSKFTLVSTASLKAIAQHFSISIEECRRRFRANIEVDGVPEFWEESMVRPQKVRVPFQIGEVLAEGVKPCPRCVVPSRNPDDGATTTLFQKKFAEFRKAALPEWSPLAAYGNYYQLAISCVFLEQQSGRQIKLHDEITR